MARHIRKVHEGNALNRDYIAMTVPLLLMGFFFNGPRVLLLALTALITARVADRIAAMMRSKKYDKTENSSLLIAMIIVLMMPVTVDYRVIITAVLVAVLVGKEAFGGYQSYPFNPAAVGFCMATVAWPQQVMSYPAPLNWLLKPFPQTFEAMWSMWNFEGATLVSGPAATLRAGALPTTSTMDLLLGNYAGPIGASCILIIAACAVYLFIKKRMSLVAPLTFLGVCVLITFLFPRYELISWSTFPYDILQRLQVVKFEMLSGALVFAAVFLVTEEGTLPKYTLSRLIYGAVLGVAAMAFRYFGVYELGICFGFLIVNAISGYFDRAIAAKSAAKKEAALP